MTDQTEQRGNQTEQRDNRPAQRPTSQATQTTQQQVNQTAWAACDTFRGVVDAGQYKDYILVMLFLKYISDLWNDRVERFQERYGGDEARIRRRLAPRALRPARGREFLRSVRTARRSEYRRADQHRPARDRGREPFEARRRVPQHRLQLGSQPRPGEGPQPPSRQPAPGFRQPGPRSASVEGVRRRHRRVLPLPHLALRVGRRQEGRGILHAVRRIPAARRSRRAEARRHDMRPGLRFPARC